MLHPLKKIPLIALALCWFIFSSINSSAQVYPGGTPYARFGLGDLNTTGFASQRGMADVSLATYDVTMLNINNPASLANLKLTTYELGFQSNYSQLYSSTEALQKQSTNFAYGFIGFKLGRRWSSSIGIMPYSSSNYSLTSVNTSGALPYTSTFNGKGGLNQFIWTNGFTINKSLQVGIRVNSIFGSIQQEQYLAFPDSFNAQQTYIVDQLSLNQLIFAPGILYKQKLKEGKTLNFGAIAELPVNISATRSQLGARILGISSTGVPIAPDTVVNVSVDGDVKLPIKYGFGISYQVESKLTVGVDIRYQDWNSFRSFGYSDSLKAGMQLSAGLQWLPDINVVGRGWKYFKLVRYRLGAKYNETYLQLRNQPINEWAVTCGFSFPLRKSLSLIHFSFEYGSRGTTQNQLIKEDIYRFTLGFSLSDLWFIKSKYD
jgi:opacity protein-like surface antigen